MKNELDVVRDISEKFEELGLAYMLTGSLAMNYYATPRMTRDIDIVIELEPAVVPRLAARLEPEYYVPLEHARRAAAERTMFNVIHQESVIKVDCIVRKESEYRRVEFERRQRISVAGFRTVIVSKEDLVLSKLVWAKDSRSELKLGDVRNLLSTGYDMDYVELWAGRLGVDSLLEETRDA